MQIHCGRLFWRGLPLALLCAGALAQVPPAAHKKFSEGQPDAVKSAPLYLDRGAAVPAMTAQAPGLVPSGKETNQLLVERMNLLERKLELMERRISELEGKKK